MAYAVYCNNPDGTRALSFLIDAEYEESVEMCKARGMDIENENQAWTIERVNLLRSASYAPTS